VDEGRKRVIGVIAAILAARKLAQYDGGKRVPATVAAIADAVRWAEEIMRAHGCLGYLCADFFAFHHFFLALRIFSIASGDIVRFTSVNLGVAGFAWPFALAHRALCARRIFSREAAETMRLPVLVLPLLLSVTDSKAAIA